MIYKIIYFKIKHLTLEKEILFCYNCINKKNNTVIFWSCSLLSATSTHEKLNVSKFLKELLLGCFSKKTKSFFIPGFPLQSGLQY